MMNEAALRPWVVLALGWVGALPAASAAEPDGGYLEAAYVRETGGGAAASGSDVAGVAASARLPISRNWFLAGSALRFEPYVDSFGATREEENRFALGLGVRRIERGQELFGQVTYIRYENWREEAGTPRVEGGALSFGARHLMGDRVSLDAEGGMGYVEGGMTHQILLLGRGSLAYRVVPHLWLYAEGSLSLLDNSMVRVGLRFTFPGPQPARQPPAVKGAERDEAAVLTVGASVVAQRPRQLQVRPAFGAPETIVVPAGGTLTLLETTSNTFGNWWRVAYGDQQGWIREGHLK